MNYWPAYKQLQLVCIELFIIVAMISTVCLFGSITAVRLGYAPTTLLAPLLVVTPVHAQTWNARVGRLYWNGNTSTHAQTWWCDTGYSLVGNHFGIRNTWNSLWYSCVAGDW